MHIYVFVCVCVLCAELRYTNTRVHETQRARQEMRKRFPVIEKRIGTQRRCFYPMRFLRICRASGARPTLRIVACGNGNTRSVASFPRRLRALPAITAAATR